MEKSLDAAPTAFIPTPVSVELRNGQFALTETSAIVFDADALRPLADVLAGEIEFAFGRRLSVKKGPSVAGDLVLRLNENPNAEEYAIDIGETAIVSGGNYHAVALGTTTLLQAIHSDQGRLNLPKLKIVDRPATEFRSVMLDLARRWHPAETIKDTIELLRLAKIRYLHLHLSDHESCTFPSRAFPKFATPGRSFTIEQWKELVRYADERGVTIIPEIDMPGHAGSWVGSTPEIFGTTDAEGKPKSTGVVNMASEKAYQGIDTLVGELCEVFKSSPYIHIGADEVSADGLKSLPEYLTYAREHGLKAAEAGQAHELLCHFVVRVDEIVRKHGRKSIVWSGFPHRGTENVKIPKDLVIMAWDAQPQDFLAAGFQVVNCCWLPLYMVPPQTRAPTTEMIFDWNIRKFDSWGWRQAIQLPPDAPILGAQLCFWEQRYNEVIPILMPRVFALGERTWSPNAEFSFAEFDARRKSFQSTVKKILHPVAMTAQGTLEPDDSRFEGKVEVRLATSLPNAVVRYALGKPWETFPTAESPVYREPLILAETTTVSAQAFSADGKPLGGITQRRFAKTEPIYRYRAFSPIPRQGWKTFPDFAELKATREGVLGRLTSDRAQQINRAMFAGVREHGHVDVRLENFYNPYAIELQGTLKVETPGEYLFKFESRDGEARLKLGDQVLKSAAKTEQKVALKAGETPFTIEHYFRAHTNDLNIQVKSPGAEKFVPFEMLVVPLANEGTTQN